jgi:hypothetical protein
VITAASASEIDLSWSASTTVGVTYALQRQATGGAFATIASNLTALTYSDKAIDPDTDYLYRVQATLSGRNSSFATAAHAAGPPPPGFAVAAPLATGTDATRFGTDISWTADANGDPAIAFASRDPNGDGDESDTRVLFLGWSRRDFAWKVPIEVDAPGVMSENGRGTSIARDDSNSTLVIAYGGTSSSGNSTALLTVSVATSTDEGATWTLRGSLPTGSDTDEPSLAVYNGTAHLASYVGNGPGSRVYYATGAIADLSTWTQTEAPLASPLGVSGAEAPLALGLDTTGAPALSYWVNTSDPQSNTAGYALVFWRPTAGASVVTSTTGVASSLDVALAFFGSAPRIAFLDDAFDPSGVYDLWTSTSTDGTSFSAPVAVPNDGDSSLDVQIGLALDAQGRAAVVSESNHNGTSSICGNPKLARSSDFTNWGTTCSPDATNAQRISGGVTGYDVVRFGKNGKLYIAGNNHAANPAGEGLADGVFIWHEP